MKRLRPILVAALAALPPAPAAAMETLPTARDDSVLRAFQDECLREEPDYDRLEKAAVAAGMTDLGSHTAPGADGATIASHRWGGTLPDGPYALYLSSVTTKAAVQTSCGISGPVADAAHFRATLVRGMALPPAPPPTEEPNGSAIYTWPDFPLPDHRLILQTKVAKDGKGFVLVTLAVKRAP